MEEIFFVELPIDFLMRKENAEYCTIDKIVRIFCALCNLCDSVVPFDWLTVAHAWYQYKVSFETHIPNSDFRQAEDQLLPLVCGILITIVTLLYVLRTMF